MQFASIIFADERSKKRIYQTSCIKYSKNDRHCIYPKHENDFDKKHKYYATWFICNKDNFCDDEHDHDLKYFGAYIQLLGCE